jgi:hydrogenase/urease accessory protein HupE
MNPLQINNKIFFRECRPFSPSTLKIKSRKCLKQGGNLFMQPSKTLLFKIGFIFFLTTSILQSQIVQAHSGSVGYSEVKLEGNQVNYDLFLLGDLVGGLLNIDKNQDGYMKENEITQSKSEIEQFVLKDLSVINNGIKGEAVVKDIQLTKRWNYDMFHISMEFTFDQPIEEYEIDYNIFFNKIDKDHQNFMTISYRDKVIEHVFTQNNIVFQGHVNPNVGQGTSTNEQAKTDKENEISVSERSDVIESSTRDEMLGFKDYLLMGMYHIWAGIDHLLFLFGLLLFKGTGKEYLKILTAFTVGHSITLALAATEILIIPGSIIEPLIALSIIYVAVENIWAKSIKWRWMVTLFFGLIHGFGFAEIILGKLGTQIFIPLLSFNLGVEIGQVAVLIVVFPFIWYLRNFRWRTQMVYSTSAIISLIGLYWFIERLMDRS